MADSGGASAKIVATLKKRRRNRKNRRPAMAPWDKPAAKYPENTPTYKPGAKKPGVPY